ncbi:unnamed protein product [Cutaneotrichosporon oleaginosum]
MKAPHRQAQNESEDAKHPSWDASKATSGPQVVGGANDIPFGGFTGRGSLDAKNSPKLYDFRGSADQRLATAR